MIWKLLLPPLHLYSGFKDTFFYPFLPFIPLITCIFTTLGWPEQEGQQASSPTWPPGVKGWLRQQPFFPPSPSSWGTHSCQVTSDGTWARTLHFCLSFTVFLFLFRFSGLEFHTKFSDEANHFRLLGDGMQVGEIQIQTSMPIKYCISEFHFFLLMV